VRGHCCGKQGEDAEESVLPLYKKANDIFGKKNSKFFKQYLPDYLGLHGANMPEIYGHVSLKMSQKICRNLYIKWSHFTI
jgi:hypothetical protein